MIMLKITVKNILETVRKSTNFKHCKKVHGCNLFERKRFSEIFNLTNILSGFKILHKRNYYLHLIIVFFFHNKVTF